MITTMLKMILVIIVWVFLMISVTKNWRKRAKSFGQGHAPFFWQCLKENVFFLGGLPFENNICHEFTGVTMSVPKCSLMVFLKMFLSLSLYLGWSRLRSLNYPDQIIQIVSPSVLWAHIYMNIIIFIKTYIFSRLWILIPDSFLTKLKNITIFSF